MLTIHTARRWDDFDIYCQGTDLIETYNSFIDLSEKLDEVAEKVDDENTVEISTLLNFTLTRIGYLISRRYIKHTNVIVKLYEGGKLEKEYRYNKSGELVGFPLHTYSPKPLPIKPKE